MICYTKPSFFEYALLTFIILWSGGGFTYGLFPYWMLFALPIVSIVFIRKKYRFTLSNWVTLAFLSLVLFLQFFKFGGSLVAVISPVLVMIVCMMSCFILRDGFTKTFVGIIYFLAFASLILWMINLLPAGHKAIDSVANVLPQLGWDNLTSLETNSTSNPRSIYLFTVSDSNSILRNSGPFWEPGRFTIYLTLALAINIFHHNEKLTSKKNLVLLATNITTFSTTGYIGMAILLVFFIIGTQRLGRFPKAFLIIFLIMVAGYVWQLDFMADKISEQAAQVDLTYSRFGAAIYHWSQIMESPIIGFGPYLSISFTDLALSPNGVTDLMRYWGIPGALLLYLFLYKGTDVYIGSENITLCVGTFATIMVLCFSQTITNSPFFFLLYFFGITSKQYKQI